MVSYKALERNIIHLGFPALRLQKTKYPMVFFMFKYQIFKIKAFKFKWTVPKEIHIYPYIFYIYKRGKTQVIYMIYHSHVFIKGASTKEVLRDYISTQTVLFLFKRKKQSSMASQLHANSTDFFLHKYDIHNPVHLFQWQLSAQTHTITISNRQWDFGERHLTRKLGDVDFWPNSTTSQIVWT